MSDHVNMKWNFFAQNTGGTRITISAMAASKSFDLVVTQDVMEPVINIFLRAFRK